MGRGWALEESEAATVKIWGDAAVVWTSRLSGGPLPVWPCQVRLPKELGKYFLQ